MRASAEAKQGRASRSIDTQEENDSSGSRPTLKLRAQGVTLIAIGSTSAVVTVSAEALRALRSA